MVGKNLIVVECVRCTQQCAVCAEYFILIKESSNAKIGNCVRSDVCPEGYKWEDE